MKKLKLFFAALALLVGGANSASAYTTSDLTSAGWTEVTSLPKSSSELGKYYYVFWDTDHDLMLAEENGNGKGGDSQENQLTGVYRTPADPASDKTKVWILQYNETNFYGIRNLSNPQLLLQSRGDAPWRVQAAWERMQSKWTQWDFAYTAGKWSIQNKLASGDGGGDNNWIGPWTKDAFQDNMVVAGNAGGNGNAKGTFKIYRKSRLSYDNISYNYATATKASPLDVTGLIANANFDYVTAGWNITGSGANAFNTEYKAFEAYHRVSGLNQDITGIPNGKYAVSVQVACRDDNATKVDENLPHLIATSAFHTVSVASNTAPKDNFGNTAKEMNDNSSYGKIVVDVNVTDGNLNIALNETNNNTWPVYDNFTLEYYGPTIIGEAVELPASGDMVADKWYYFDIAEAADDYSATATTLGDIVYTSDGTILIEDQASVTTNFTATDNSLSVTRYYVKSSSANNLKIEATMPTTEDKTALADAITAAEAKTLGFENGEYAPYNNVEAIETLAAAKAVNPETAIRATVVAATTALTGATWTANVGEVSAIYWQDYTSGDIAGDGYIHPLGWSNTGYNTRIYSDAAGNKGDNSGISAVNDLAIMMKYNTTYGETTGYTMPLKAATIYKITFKYCGWGNNPTTNIVLTDPSDNTISLAPGFRPASNDGNTNAEHWYNYTGYFVSTTAGNYVLAMNKVEGGQQQIGIGDIELVSASEIEFADGSVPTYAPGTYPSVKITRTLTADKWATAIYPFAVSGVDDIAVLDSYNKATGALGFTTAAASEANKPFLMRSTSGVTEINLSDVAVSAAAATDVTKSEASLKGVYASTNITNEAKNYVLSNNQIFSVGTAGATINPYRAYIQISQDQSARELKFVVDDEVLTGIGEIEASGSTLVKDGKYLEKGNIVIYKYGKKVSATGARLY